MARSKKQRQGRKEEGGSRSPSLLPSKVKVKGEGEGEGAAGLRGGSPCKKGKGTRRMFTGDDTTPPGMRCVLGLIVTFFPSLPLSPFLPPLPVPSFPLPSPPPLPSSVQVRRMSGYVMECAATHTTGTPRTLYLYYLTPFVLHCLMLYMLYCLTLFVLHCFTPPPPPVFAAAGPAS